MAGQTPKSKTSLFAPVSVAAGVLLISAVLGLLFGSENASIVTALADPASLDRVLIFEIRLPRLVMAAVAGGGLSIVGASFQALLRNPLAEPYVLGVSGGAALGATTAIAVGVSVTTLFGSALIPAAAFAGGLAATLLVYAIAKNAEHGSSGTSILLAGVMVNAIAAALVTFLKTFVSPSRAQQLMRWLVGFVDLPTTTTLVAVGGYVAVGAAVLLVDAARMNLLALGDDTAGALGVDVRALTRRTFFATSCIVGAIVSVTGLIGFVGLVVPHALRRVIGPDQRALLPASLFAGAAMVLLCDLISRLLFRWLGTEPPVGAVTAMIGGPIFLAMLARPNR
ncbi:MAG: iron ABC transporter permease [Polyangiaceae bacterium]|nr:iron ABC transporter permease [Polyangiaceae bacterium]